MPPCPAPDTCWLYLIRHAATENNRADPPRLQGRRLDVPLSPEGFEQASRTARFLAPLRVDAVYSSPLLRARQTAEAIAQPHGLGVQCVEAITEVDVGQWEGLSWDEAQRRDPEAARAFMADAGTNPYLGGETMQEVDRRVVPAFGTLLGDNVGRAIVVVAHNVVNRVYLAHLFGLPAARYRSITQDNGGISLLRFGEGQTKPITVNSLFHLGDPVVQ